MHEYFISESHASVGLAWAQGNCTNVRHGHKHEAHIDGTRACPGFPTVALFSLDRSSLPIDEPQYNMWKERIDEPDPLADVDDQIRRAFV